MVFDMTGFLLLYMNFLLDSNGNFFIENIGDGTMHMMPEESIKASIINKERLGMKNLLLNMSNRNKHTYYY